MSWQIQCKQHFLKQLYTLNNQLESEEILTWHEDVQMYCWDCMRVRGGVREGDYNECWACMRLKRGAMFCCVWDFLRVVWGSVREVWELLWENYESCWEKSMRVTVREVWELFREACEREKMVWNLWVVQITCEREKMVWNLFSISIEPRRTDLTTQPVDMTKLDWWEMTRADQIKNRVFKTRFPKRETES